MSAQGAFSREEVSPEQFTALPFLYIAPAGLCASIHPFFFAGGYMMKYMTVVRTAGMVSALLLSLVSTDAIAGPFRYSYIEGGFGDADEADALFVNGAYRIDKQLDLIGGLYSYDDKAYDGTGIEAGVQFHQPINGKADFFASAQLYRVSVDIDLGPWGSGSATDTGLMLKAGARYAVDSKLQLEGLVSISDNDAIDDGLGFQGNVRYYIDPKLSLAAGLASDTELDGLFVGVRYDVR